MCEQRGSNEPGQPAYSLIRTITSGTLILRTLMNDQNENQTSSPTLYVYMHVLETYAILPVTHGLATLIGILKYMISTNLMS